MNARFDDWEGQHLEHHGIPGMSWGTRRYQNKDGSLTALGKARYGIGKEGGTKRTSAHKMQRDFNRLDKGYANVHAEHLSNYKKLGKAVRKTEKYAKKKGYFGDPNKTKTEGANDKKLKRLAEKAKKARDQVALTEKQQKAIENLQWRILAKANEAGYTSSTKGVLRTGTTKRGRGIANAAGILLGGGAIGGAAIGGALGASSKMVVGSKAKIRKKGDGSTKIGSYNGKPVTDDSQMSRTAKEGREWYEQMNKKKKQKRS